MMSIPYDVAIYLLALIYTLPFTAAAVALAFAVGRIVRNWLIASLVGATVAVVALWVLIYSTIVLFLHPSTLEGETPWWQNVAYPLAVLSVPVSIVSAITAWLASKYSKTTS